MLLKCNWWLSWFAQRELTMSNLLLSVIECRKPSCCLRCIWFLYIVMRIRLAYVATYDHMLVCRYYTSLSACTFHTVLTVKTRTLIHCWITSYERTVNDKTKSENHSVIFSLESIFFFQRAMFNSVLLNNFIWNIRYLFFIEHHTTDILDVSVISDSNLWVNNIVQCSQIIIDDDILLTMVLILKW